MSDVNNFLEKLNLNTTISESVIDHHLTCSVPEHHNVNDKIDFYSKNNYPSLYSVQPTAPPYNNYQEKDN